MPERSPFDYAVVRVVPNVEREEFINVGVILFARPRRFLGCRIHLDTRRLAVLAPDIDRAEVQEHLDLIQRICSGGSNAGPIGRLDQPDRFHWLVSPRSTVIQVSAAHSGVCDDPQAALDDLFEKLVD